MIDNIDKKILSFLQNNARITNTQIARELGLAPSGIHERIRKLEEKKIITGYHAAVDARKLGYCVTAFLFVRTNDRVGSVESAVKLAEIPEIQEVHHIAGEDCYLIKLRCADNPDLGRLLRDKIGPIESIQSSRTSVVMETIKEKTDLPILEDECKNA